MTAMTPQSRGLRIAHSIEMAVGRAMVRGAHIDCSQFIPSIFEVLQTLGNCCAINSIMDVPVQLVASIFSASRRWWYHAGTSPQTVAARTAGITIPVSSSSSYLCLVVNCVGCSISALRNCKMLLR
jgi:hypothetical protein